MAFTITYTETHDREQHLAKSSLGDLYTCVFQGDERFTARWRANLHRGSPPARGNMASRVGHACDRQEAEYFQPVILTSDIFLVVHGSSEAKSASDMFLIPVAFRRLTFYVLTVRVASADSQKSFICRFFHVFTRLHKNKDRVSGSIA